MDNLATQPAQKTNSTRISRHCIGIHGINPRRLYSHGNESGGVGFCMRN